MSTSLEARIQRIEDELEISQLRAHYCHLLDNKEWDAFVDLFTEDGVFQGLNKVEGKQQLMQFFSVDVPKIADHFWHFCTNGTIDIDGDEATGRISMEYISITNGVSYVSAGHYDDVCVRIDGKWKFKSRKITFYFYSPFSEGFTGSLPESAKFD